MSIRYQHESGEHDVEIHGSGSAWRVLLDGREVPVSASASADGDGQVEVTVDGANRRVYVAADGDERWVFVGGRTIRLRRRDPDTEEVDGAAAASPDIRAAMPGKVVKLLVEDGQPVAFGQPVIILESMKMETELTASVDGTVTGIHVAAGETVGQDALLVEIAPTASTD